MTGSSHAINWTLNEFSVRGSWPQLLVLVQLARKGGNQKGLCARLLELREVIAVAGDEDMIGLETNRQQELGRLLKKHS